MAGVGFVDPEEDAELLEEPSSLLLRRAVCDLKLNVTQVPPG